MFKIKMLHKKIVKNTGWNIGGKFLAQAIVPLFAILIARILDPRDFGLFAMATAIIGFIDLIKDLGISQAIIIEQDDNNLISMQFTVQFFLGVIVYGIIFILAGYLSLYFGMPALKTALRVYALIIFLYCLEYPLETYYMKNNRYNVLFYRQILPVLLYGIITYLLALKGYGVFALIGGHLLGRGLTVCFLLFKSGWRPSFYFDPAVFLRLFNLGKHILAQSACGFFITHVDSLIIGKLLGAYNLGTYKTANTLAHLVPNAVTSPVQKVIFSDLAQRRNDHAYYTLRYYQFFYIVGFVAFILSIATYFVSSIFITAIMGSKWTKMIPLVQIFCVALPTSMIAGINYDYSRILGFSHVYTIFSVVRAMATLIVIYVGSLVSLEFAVICLVVVSLIDNVVSEICFFSNQAEIKYNTIKLVFFALAWLWALYVIMQRFIKT